MFGGGQVELHSSSLNDEERRLLLATLLGPLPYNALQKHHGLGVKEARGATGPPADDPPLMNLRL